MPTSTHEILGALILPYFDALMSLRAQLLDVHLLQELGSLYVACVLLLSIGMFTYWFVSAAQVLLASDEQLTEAEFDNLRWAKGLLDYFVRVAEPLRWTLQ